MNIREWLTLILAVMAISSVYYLIFSDPFFLDTLLGRAMAITALSVVCFGCFIAGICQKIDEVSDERPD